jgi:ATP-dependent DNA helicase RecG
VAALAAYQAISNGYQVALLAPTAILATQHAEGLDRLLRPLGVTVALLTGATKQKDALKTKIKNGEVDFVIGTHALLTDDTLFKSLALCIIDEQHRFGVNQRQKLLTKTAITTPGLAPHFLAMTATPIPRSLQLTIFGDLDVSVLKQLPKGRQPIQTEIMNEYNMKDALYPALKSHLVAGEQAYWICRLIDETSSTNATDDKKTVVKEAARLKKVFPAAKIEYLHGKMKQDEKDRLMSDFANKKIDILVSTTVVEVGVDVPNATQIVIMDAEGYGLAQLHQLRGRVGRGTKPSNCYLVISGENPPSQRLRELEKSTDGFYLAEVDLRLRGPGEIYGSMQHGELDLRVASLTDTPLIAAASKQAKAFARGQNMVKYEELAQTIAKYQQLTTLN